MFKKFKRAMASLVYMPNGDFSISRLIMVGVSFTVISLIWVGVAAFLLWGKVLPDNIYVFAGGLWGGGATQYGYTKFMTDRKDARVSDCPPGAVEVVDNDK